MFGQCPWSRCDSWLGRGTTFHTAKPGNCYTGVSKKTMQVRAMASRQQILQESQNKATSAAKHTLLISNWGPYATGNAIWMQSSETTPSSTFLYSWIWTAVFISATLEKRRLLSSHKYRIAASCSCYIWSSWWLWKGLHQIQNQKTANPLEEWCLHDGIHHAEGCFLFKTQLQEDCSQLVPQLNWAKHAVPKHQFKLQMSNRCESIICMQWSANLSSRENLPRMSIPHPHLFLLCLQISSCPSQPVGSSDMPWAYPTSGLCAPKACSTRRRSSWRPATRLCLATAKPSWDLVENCSGHLEVHEEAVEFQNHPKPELPMLKGHF